jgi:hypothetical protein
VQFEKANFRTFFHKFIKQFFNKRFNNPWKHDINRIHETLKMTLCNSRKETLVDTWFKEQHFKIIGESLDDRADPETMRCLWFWKEVIDQQLKDKE